MTQEQSDVKVQVVRFGWAPGTGASVPVELGCTTLLHPHVFINSEAL